MKKLRDVIEWCDAKATEYERIGKSYERDKVVAKTYDIPATVLRNVAQRLRETAEFHAGMPASSVATPAASAGAMGTALDPESGEDEPDAAAGSFASVHFPSRRAKLKSEHDKDAS